MLLVGEGDEGVFFLLGDVRSLPIHRAIAHGLRTKELVYEIYLFPLLHLISP